ncbi:Tyrosine kinase receptor Cad96Ca [Nymphon striatum]|nr:Tyrosine kinase receptor Cad96Ca [Nymphon striatum]
MESYGKLWKKLRKATLGHGQGFHLKNAPPVFDFKRNWRIPENEPVGSKVTKVTAKDEGDTRLVFDIEPATTVESLDGSTYFRIDPDSGDVFLVHSLEGQAGNDFYLHVAAYDGIYKTKIEVHVRVLKANSYTGPRLVIPLTTKPGQSYTLPPPSKVTTPRQRRPPFRTSPRPHLGSNPASPGHITQNPNLYGNVKSFVPPNYNGSEAKNGNPLSTREPPEQVDGNLVIRRERLLLIVIIPITIIGLAVIVLAVYTIHKRIKEKQGLNLDSIEAKDKFDWMSGGFGKAIKSRKNLLRAISNRYESDNPVMVLIDIITETELGGGGGGGMWGNNSPVSQYWSIVLHLELLLNVYVRSLRQASFTMYLDALTELACWFHAMDHMNYARWIPVHLKDMSELPERHPEVARKFREGSFTVQKTKKISSIAIDQAHEQNNACIKGDGGAVGLTDNPAALRRWMIAGPEVARVIEEVQHGNQHSG